MKYKKDGLMTPHLQVVTVIHKNYIALKWTRTLILKGEIRVNKKSHSNTI
jgi:hypothetical protein